jgi:hypothetical protein
VNSKPACTARTCQKRKKKEVRKEKKEKRKKRHRPNDWIKIKTPPNTLPI